MLGRKSLLAFLSNFSVRFLNAVIFIIAVNIFSPTNFGYYQVAVSIMAIFLLLSDLGVDRVQIKKIAESENKNVVFTSFLIIKIILIFFSTIITFCILFIQISIGILSSSYNQIIIIILIYFQRIFGKSLSSIYSLSLWGETKVVRVNLPIILSNFLAGIFSLIAILFFRSFLLYIFVGLLSGIFQFLLFLLVSREFKLTKVSLDLLSEYLKAGFGFFVPTFFITLTKSLGTFFFLIYFEEDLLGVYLTFSTLFEMITILHGTIQMLLIPNYSWLLKNKKINQLRFLINTYQKYMIILNGIIIIGGLIFSEIIIKLLFGNFYYINGLILFQLFLISLLEYPLVYSYIPLFLASEDYKIYTFLNILEFLFSIIIWIFFTQILNLLAIAFIRWVFIIPKSYIFRIYCQKNFGLGKTKKREKRNLITILILILISFFITQFNFNFNFSCFIFLILIGFYFGFLIINGSIKKKDLLYILDSFNPLKMKDYIKSEMKKLDTDIDVK